jgi:hypothetical protein
MSFAPTSQQTLFMLLLVFGPREPKLSDVRLELPAAQRKELETDGLIRLERRGRSDHVILTARGGAWVQEHLDSPIPATGAAPGLVLAALLPLLKAFLAVRGSTLGELLLSPREPAARAAVTHEPGDDSEAEHFVAALQRLDAGEHRFVPLCDLRTALPELARTQFDAAALALQAQGRIALFRIDEPWRRSPSIEDAAIDVAGNRYHSAYLKR